MPAWFEDCAHTSARNPRSTPPATALKTALDRADRNAPARATLDQLDALAKQLDQDAGAASARDGVRLRSLAAAIKSRTAKLRQ